jgi:RNA polymerase sigma-70 factor (ECF subfamily)
MPTINNRAEDFQHPGQPSCEAIGAPRALAPIGPRIGACGMATRAWNDADLMILMQRNDLRAFELFYDRHVAAALRVAMGVLHDRHLAEDAVQEGFLGLWRSRTSYRPKRGTGKSWLLVIVSHRAIDLNRREPNGRVVLSGGAPSTNRPGSDCTEAEATAHVDHEQLRAQLQRLPGEQRQVIELAYFGGLTHTEIAERLQLPLGTTKGRLRLGLEKLRPPTADQHVPVY